jgi:hypothetical protein
MNLLALPSLQGISMQGIFSQGTLVHYEHNEFDYDVILKIKNVMK